ncbi:hypothetical protein F5Y13DRAFT_23609 [Hypoxylon sp. FL1857]|nr:hypothetical protein F5Y13DRAFT_23609 [Hypoxylon sp. FL1857]
MSVTSLILLGQYEESGKVFSDALKPNYEVVHFSTSPTAALADILTVLKGSIPTSATSSTQVGTGNLSHGAPKAIIIAASLYDDAWIAAARAEVAAAGKHVVFLKPDASSDHAGKGTADKTKVAAEHAVKVLRKLEGEGKLDGDDDGVYVY